MSSPGRPLTWGDGLPRQVIRLYPVSACQMSRLGARSREYIADGAAEALCPPPSGSVRRSASGWDEVLAAVQRLRSWESAAALAGEGSLIAGGSAGMPAMAVVRRGCGAGGSVQPFALAMILAGPPVIPG